MESEPILPLNENNRQIVIEEFKKFIKQIEYDRQEIINVPFIKDIQENFLKKEICFDKRAVMIVEDFCLGNDWLVKMMNRVGYALNFFQKLITNLETSLDKREFKRAVEDLNKRLELSIDVKNGIYSRKMLKNMTEMLNIYFEDLKKDPTNNFNQPKDLIGFITKYIKYFDPSRDSIDIRGLLDQLFFAGIINDTSKLRMMYETKISLYLKSPQPKEDSLRGTLQKFLPNEAQKREMENIFKDLEEKFKENLDFSEIPSKNLFYI